jgi:hypothetical protein
MPTLSRMDHGGGAGRRRFASPHAIGVAAGGLAGAALVALVFVRVGWDGGPVLRPRFDAATFARGLGSHAGWVAPFAAIAACLPVLRALVWLAVLPPPVPPPGDAYHATALGALVHNTVPGKLGPVAAAWLLARGRRASPGAAPPRFASALSSQLLAKLLEMGAVVALGALAASLRPAAAVVRVVVLGAVAFAALASAAAATALGAPRAAARLARRAPRAGAALAALGEGIAGAGRPGRLAVAAALAALPALAAAAAYGLPLRALGVEGSGSGGAVLLAVITFGQLTPGLPVGTGVYWSLSAWAARALGAALAAAAAVAVLSHSAMVVANIAVGAASAVVRRGALRELLRRRREVERLAAAAPADTSRRTTT